MAFEYSEADVESLSEVFRPGQVDDAVRAGVIALFESPDFEAFYWWMYQRMLN